MWYHQIRVIRFSFIITLTHFLLLSTYKARFNATRSSRSFLQADTWVSVLPTLPIRLLDFNPNLTCGCLSSLRTVHDAVNDMQFRLEYRVQNLSICQKCLEPLDHASILVRTTQHQTIVMISRLLEISRASACKTTTNESADCHESRIGRITSSSYLSESERTTGLDRYICINLNQRTKSSNLEVVARTLKALLRVL